MAFSSLTVISGFFINQVGMPTQSPSVTRHVPAVEIEKRQATPLFH